ncbi:MAG: Gfo/Idh/MocA family oxidoreductase [Lachnospiraceae bacterium]|nr:Gfo/Idh/MocA family oxidoreductase [Lachnospiraceae bacterium]
MKTAILGTWHVHAGGYAGTAAELGTLTGVWEENEAWCREFAERFGIRQYASREELLADDIDGVIICSATNRHKEDVIAAARAGKAIFIEKVLALTEADCTEIRQVLKETGVPFVISFPWKFNGAVLTVRSLVESGDVGRVNYIRFRNAHTGSSGDWLPPHFYNAAQCGGGAMIDLGAHGMYLIDMLKGLPESYSSAFGLFCGKPSVLEKNVDRVEDNAVTAMTYADGCVAVNETGFNTSGCPTILEVGGEEGYITMTGDTVVHNSPATEHKTVPAALLPGQPAPIVQFMNGKVPEGCGIEEAIRLTVMMEGAYRRR